MKSNLNPDVSKVNSSQTDARLVEVVSDIWKSVLGTDAVALQQAFLDLGGDSLSAMLCISRIKRSTGVELDVEDFLMNDSSIENLASLLKQKLTA